MRRILVSTAVLAGAAALGWWLYQRQGEDRFDYEAVFEAPAAGEGGAAPAVALAAFAGKDREAVRQALGEPQRCEAGRYSERCRYGGAGVEITFIDGRADWITVPLADRGLPLASEALAALGLPSREPDVVDAHQSVWRGLGGYREVRIAGGDQGASYARIKVATP